MGKEEILAYLDSRKEEFYQFSDQIWETPELCFKETQSCAQYVAFLKKEGFRVEQGVGGLPTSFLAEYGSGKPVIAFLAEYDALPGLSQEANIVFPKKREGHENGHGCGHNLLGSAMMASAVAMKKYLEQNKGSGTVRLYGTPAEEGGLTKGYMVRDGLFRDVDIALGWHPDNMNYMIPATLLSVIILRYRFEGVEAHASMCPHLGRSALDAVTLLNVGTQFLREHVTSDVRIHYAVTNSGGMSANIVQKDAETVYMVRAPRVALCQEVADRLTRVAEGAALMTETTLTTSFVNGTAELLPNYALERIVYRNFEELGAAPIDEADKKFAAEMQKNFSPEHFEADSQRAISYYGAVVGEEVAKKLKDKPVSDFLYPHVYPTGLLFGSTDVGEVSQAVPTAQISTACFARGTPNHTWQIVAQSKAPLAHKAMLHAAKVLAASAIDIFDDPTLLEAVRAEFQERRGGKEYISIIPPGAKPY